MSKKKWKQDDRVVVDVEGELYAGAIVKLTKSKAKVLLDDGDVHTVELVDLKTENQKGFIPEGFHQYDIKWDKDTINFSFNTEGGKFFGWWRKIQVKDGKTAYGVDLHVEYESKKYSIDTLGYRDTDPRDDLQSLNADICAAANKWFYHKCKGNFDTIEELEQRAAKPTIIIERLETLDRIILKLKEYRDTALRSGGLRVMTFTGDDPDKDPSMRIQMDLTTQALALEGRVPSLFDGTILDRVADDNSKRTKGRGKPIEVEADSKNINELLKKLHTSGNKSEQRKLRALLRKLGHKGGARSSSKKGDKK